MTAPGSHSVPRASWRKTRWKKNLSPSPARHGNIRSKEQPLLLWGPNTRYQQAEWVGSVWRTLHSDIRTQQCCCNCCSWCFVSSDSRLRFKARRKLVTHHQWDPQKTKGKVPPTSLPTSLVSRYVDTMLGNFSGMRRHSCKMFLFSCFHLFPRVIWGYVEQVQL